MSPDAPLLVAAHLPSPLRVPLRIALGEGHRIVEAVNWDDLSAILRQRPVDLLIVDPAAEGGVDVEIISELMKQHPKTPLMVYTALTPTSVSALAELSKRGLRDVVLHRIDDTPERFQKVIERVARRQSSHQAVEGLTIAMEQLPDEIQQAIKQMFDRPKAFDSTTDVATMAGVTLSRFYRSLRRAGIRSPKRLLIAARVLRAHSYMREPGHSIREVSAKLGYSHPKVLARHTNQALGVKPRHLRRRMSDEVIVERLVDWIYDLNASD